MMATTSFEGCLPEKVRVNILESCFFEAFTWALEVEELFWENVHSGARCVIKHAVQNEKVNNRSA